MDVTGLAVGVTVALAVGIIVLVAALAVYVKSRRRVDKLRQMATTTTGRVQRRTTTAAELQLPDIIRRRAAANQLTKRMTGYPGRMYMPGELNGMEGGAYYPDDSVAQNDGFVPFDAYDDRNDYERRIVPDRNDNESLLSDWVDWISDSSDSSSDDDTRHRSCTRRRHASARCPVQPVPVVVPAAAMTSALVHPAPVVVQPQQPAASVLPPAPQPSVFVPAATTATTITPAVRPSPPAVQPHQPTPSWPSAIVKASARNYAVRDRGAAVFTAAQQQRGGRVEYAEQERAAVATERATRSSALTRPAGTELVATCTGGVDAFRRTDRGRATWHRASTTVEHGAVRDEYEMQELAPPPRPTPAPRTSIHGGMAVTARAMVHGPQQGRSTR